VNAASRLSRGVAADLYDDIFGRSVAGIPEGMQGAKCYVNRAAGAGAFFLAVVVELQSALRNQDQL
jgi:hypothetical protein